MSLVINSATIFNVIFFIYLCIHTRPIATPYAVLCYATRYAYNWLIVVDIRVYLSGALSKLNVRLLWYHSIYDSLFVLFSFQGHSVRQRASPVLETAPSRKWISVFYTRVRERIYERKVVKLISIHPVRKCSHGTLKRT